MQVEVTANLVALVYDASLRSFWRKSALRQFLRSCHISDSFLSTWAEDESKRDFLDRAFASLQKSDRGKAVIAEMAFHLSEQTSFPDLLNWEDSQEKVAAARRSVAALKTHLNIQGARIHDEREAKARREATHKAVNAAKRSSSDLAQLGERLKDLVPQMGTSAGGYAFQDWFYDLVAYAEIEHRRPYVTAGRQIDGSITLDGTTYLVELKFTKDQADATDIDSIRAKVESKADNTMGLFVAMSGYSSVAVREASGKRTTLLLIDASHVYAVLTQTVSLSDCIRRVRRHAAQTGEALLAVDRFGE